MYNYFSRLKIVISIGLHIKLDALNVTNFFFIGKQKCKGSKVNWYVNAFNFAQI